MKWIPLPHPECYLWRRVFPGQRGSNRMTRSTPAAFKDPRSYGRGKSCLVAPVPHGRTLPGGTVGAQPRSLVVRALAGLTTIC